MASRKPTGGLEDVARMMAGAKVVEIGKAGGGIEEPAPPPTGQDGGGGQRWRGREEPELPMLPADCPIVCLGKRKQRYYFLDELGELIELAADKVAQKGIISLFGRQSHLLREFWPRYAKPYEDKVTGALVTDHVNGWKVDVASELLMAACAMEGVFDPIARVRGRGAHLNHDGALILHCGDRVLVGSAPARDDPDNPGEVIAARPPRWHHPGLLGDYVYPTGPSGQRPSTEPQGPEWAEQLLGKLGSWHWKRAIDPVLLLGGIIAMRIGGALRWRPHIWVTGDSATGKTTLQELLEQLFDGSMLQSADATEAGIRQVLGHDTLPVALDEAEAEDNGNQRLNALVKLARIASSGSAGVRGGSDHQGHTFTIKSCFLFSSVLMPAMLPQDRNRLAILELMPLARDAKPPPLDPVWLRACGRALTRRVVDQWERFEAIRVDYRAMLAEVGHGGRSADQFGTLLACADLALYDFDPPPEVAEARLAWAQQLDADKLVERADEMSNADRCAAWISNSPLQATGGEIATDVGTWCLRTLDNELHDKARARLAAAGLRVVQVTERDGRALDDEHAELSIADPVPFVKCPVTDPATAASLFLAVASTHRGLDVFFKETPWAGRAGASGAWGQALRRCSGAIPGKRTRIGGKTQAVVLVPLSLVAQIDQGLMT